MEIKLKEKIGRLNRFYGDVYRSQNESIIAAITGKSIIDIGCGYGFLVKQMMDTNRFNRVVGIDTDAESVAVAHNLHQGIDIKKMDIFKMDFPDNCFETAIFRESIHHLNIDKALNAVKRICSKEIIIFDPNPNFILRLSRKLINHKDDEVSLEILIEVLTKNNLKVNHYSYRDVIAFPLSGAMVGLEVCPDIRWLKKILILIDKKINKLLNFLELQKYFCWRYIVKAEVRKV